MKNHHLIFSIAGLLVLFGLMSFQVIIGQQFNNQQIEAFIQSIEKGHKAKKFHRKDVVAFDIVLHFGGKKRMESTIYSKTNSSAIRIDYKDKGSLWFDGEKVYSTIENPKAGSLKFDLFTWQYFFMAPYKFGDPGTNWELTGPKNYQNAAHQTAKLTFESFVSDTPNDWYVVYQDPAGIVKAMGYIVTYTKSIEEAEEEPHAITYDEFVKVNGIPFATAWEFWLYDEEKGIYGDPIGNAALSNIRFVKEEQLFDIPAKGQEL